MNSSYGTHDSYAESVVKREKTFKITAIKAFIVAAIATIFLMSFLYWSSIALFFGVVALVLAFVFLPYFNTEYECVFVNGQFDFDLIMNGSHRKKMLRIDLDNSEIMALTSSHELDSFRNNPKYAVKDFSSLKKEAKTYSIVGKDSKGKLVFVTFEASDKMIELVKANPTLRRKFKEF